MSRYHSEEERNQAIKAIQNGRKIAEICEQFHISRSTLHLWLQQSKPQETSPYSARELYLMKEELNRLILDSFSRKVIAYHTSLSNDADLAFNTFLKAYQIRGKPTALIFHSDRDSQYTSSDFGQLMSEFKVVQSFSAAGSPHDNAVAESFFASLKKEEIRRHCYQTESECRLAIEQRFRLNDKNHRFHGGFWMAFGYKKTGRFFAATR